MTALSIIVFLIDSNPDGKTAWDHPYYTQVMEQLGKLTELLCYLDGIVMIFSSRTCMADSDIVYCDSDINSEKNKGRKKRCRHDPQATLES